MKLVLDDLINTEIEELKEYLLQQEGIIDVKYNKNKPFIVLNIKYNKNTTPEIIIKYIELFQKYNYSILFEFDKGSKGDFKTLKYTIDDMCCEYCYRNLVMDLFENENIKSVKSNFEYNKPAFNIEFEIEYEKYSEKELIEYIKEKNN